MPIIFTSARNFCLVILFFFCRTMTAQVPNIEFQSAINSLVSVTDIVNAGDGSNRLFVVSREGTIKVYDQSLTFLGDFLNVSEVNSYGGERGLLSMAFHPDYSTNGYFYVYYTGGGNGDITLARYSRSTTNPNEADPNSKVVLLAIPKPVEFNPPHQHFDGHNGGKLNFGPEGYLYFGIGDGGSGYDPYNNSQDGNSLFGKMIRLDINNETPQYYFIPADNPYTSDPNIRDEIWALGLRNPWRWSFDKLTHDMWIADVGQRDREEIDFRPAGDTGGVNYGWNCYEGSIPTPTVPPCTPPNYVPPIFDYAHAVGGGQAIIGGYVY